MVAVDDKGLGKMSMVQKDDRISSILQSEKMKFEVVSKAGKIEEKFDGTIKTKLYKRRWLQLGLFCIYCAVNSMQWTQLTIVGNIISRYYGVSSLAVDWTSIIFHVAYITLLFPASYVMDRVGLRWICLIGSIGTSIGSLIKVFSVSPDRFVLLFFGQTLVAGSQIFVLSGPARLAAVWFGPKEVATATAVACSSGLVGVGLLFLIAPLIVKNHERIEDIGDELSIFLTAVAVVSIVGTLAMIFFFEDSPPLPPSGARAFQIRNPQSERKGVLVTFKRIFANKTFFMLWNSYGMNVGFMNVACILLNPFFLAHFQNGEADAGVLGLLINLPGTVGSIIFGIILDKTKKFKAVSIFIYGFIFVGQILFAAGLMMEIKWLVFVAVTIIGIFSISHQSISFELSAEATYPESEELSSVLLNLAQHVYGSILVLLVGILLRTYGDLVAHACLFIIVTSGLVLTMFAGNELRRQNARETAEYGHVALLQIVQSELIDKQSIKTDYK